MQEASNPDAGEKVVANGSSEIRLLVADQNRMNCQLLMNALKRSRRIKIVTCATGSDQIFSEVKATDPNVALISATLQDGSLSGFSVARALRNEHPQVRTILLVDSPERGWVIDAFRAGAKGIFCREDSLSTLCKCIHAVHRGQIWAKSEELESLVEAFARVAPPRLAEDNVKVRLSRREQEVAELASAGLSNREIASQLGLSEHTIKNYVFHIFDKLGISSRLELVLYARSLDGSHPPAVKE